MNELDQAVRSFFDHLEQRLLATASMSKWNAALALGDPACLLPSPAVALIQVEGPTPPTAAVAFRSVEPLGESGEVWFAPVHGELTVLPWAVEDSEWILAAQTGGDKGRPLPALQIVRGLRIGLRRLADGGSGTGWLNLHVVAGPSTCWGLHRASAVWGGTPIPLRPFPNPLPLGSGRPRQPMAVHHHVNVMTQDLLQVELRDGGEAGSRADLELLFEEPIPLSNHVAPPIVTVNVIPVWNSLDVRYPEPQDAEQWTAETARRWLHPLTASHLGPDWRAWSIREVHCAGRTRESLPVARPYPFAGQAWEADAQYRLCFAPMTSARRSIAGSQSGGGEEDMVLSVWLSQQARRALDSQNGRLAIAFRATTGPAGNGIPAGTEFSLMRLDGFPSHITSTGKLLCTSWGGSNGLVGSPPDAVALETVQAVQPLQAPRSVGDLLTILELSYGDVVEPVDERDLLRFSDEEPVAPLRLRLRFRDSHRSPWEKRMILQSCEGFLQSYLAGQTVGGIKVIEE